MIKHNLCFLRNACAIILKVAYGYPMGGYEDEFVKIIDDGFAAFGTLNAPGRFFIEYFPWCEYKYCYVHLPRSLTFHSEICSLLVPWCRVQAIRSEDERRACPS